MFSKVCRLYSKRKLVTNKSSQAIKTKLEQPHRRAHQPSLAIIPVSLGVANGIQDSADAPAHTHQRAGNRVAQTRDEHGGEHGGVILEVVSVSALGAVEEVERLLLLRGACGGHVGRVGVRGGIGDGWAGGFAEDAAAAAVPETEEEGGCCGEEDVAIWCC